MEGPTNIEDSKCRAAFRDNLGDGAVVHIGDIEASTVVREHHVLGAVSGQSIVEDDPPCRVDLADRVIAGVADIEAPAIRAEDCVVRKRPRRNARSHFVRREIDDEDDPAPKEDHHQGAEDHVPPTPVPAVVPVIGAVTSGLHRCRKRRQCQRHRYQYIHQFCSQINLLG